MCYYNYRKRKEREANNMNKYTVRIFDGKYTTIYTTEDKDIFVAENKILRYHRALGGSVVKVTTTEQRA